MKLSDLVHYKNALEQLSTRTLKKNTATELDEILHLVQNQSIQVENITQTLVNQTHDIHQGIDAVDSTLQQLKEKINNMIAESERPWFQESYRLYEEEMCHETTDYILNRRPVLNHDSEMVLRNRIRNYTDWKYPGMVIRPGLENFVTDMVGLDPLYIIDQDYELLRPAMEKFPEEYQRRLRPYVIHESIDYPILDKIPDNQFGLCFVYNFFEFRPFEYVKKYLGEIYQKLRPGGVLILTYNDCDRYKAVTLVERHYCCYTPGRMIQEFAKSIGYEQIFIWDDNGPTSWLELRKPGQLTSLRGGQTLAKIIPK